MDPDLVSVPALPSAVRVYRLLSLILEEGTWCKFQSSSRLHLKLGDLLWSCCCGNHHHLTLIPLRLSDLRWKCPQIADPGLAASNYDPSHKHIASWDSVAWVKGASILPQEESDESWSQKRVCFPPSAPPRDIVFSPQPTSVTRFSPFLIIFCVQNTELK